MGVSSCSQVLQYTLLVFDWIGVTININLQKEEGEEEGEEEEEEEGEEEEDGGEEEEDGEEEEEEEEEGEREDDEELNYNWIELILIELIL